MKKTTFAPRLAWSIAALSVTLAIAGLAGSLLVLVQSDSQGWLPPNQWLSLLSTVTFALVGALVASRHPRNPFGWICDTVAVLTGLTIFTFGYRLAGQSGRGTLPGIEFARWLNTWIWIPATILPLTFLLLLFPDGRLPSARWRPIGWSAGLGLAAYTLGIALHPRPQIEPNPAPNPFGIAGAAAALDLLVTVATILIAVGAMGSVAALVIRFRRSHGTERAQLKWLAYAGVVGLLVNLAINALYVARPNDPFAYELSLIGITATLAAIALAAGIAILRHRLYDIDLVINRTLVYSALTALLALAYLGSVLVLQSIFQILTGRGQDQLVAVVSTLGIAALFLPLRRRLQAFIDRRFFRRKYDAAHILAAFAASARADVDLDQLTRRLLDVVDTTLQPEQVWLCWNLPATDRPAKRPAPGREA